MKKSTKKIVLGACLGVLATGMLGSCAFDEMSSRPGSAGMLAKSPEVTAYSGDHTWDSYGSGTRSAQPNSNEWGTDLNNGKYKDFPKPDPITPEERAKVVEVFSQKGAESYLPLVDWENFFVQQVYCGPEGRKMTELACVSNQHQTSYWPEIFETGDWYDDTVNNFNNGAYSGNEEDGCMLMFHSSTLDWSWKSTQGGGERFHNWRMEYIDGAYYIGFDFQSNKQGSEANENELFERDYIYNDWIIKIVPGLGVEIPVPGEGDGDHDGDHEDTCPNCDHAAHVGQVCPDCRSMAPNGNFGCATMDGAFPLPGDGEGEGDGDGGENGGENGPGQGTQNPGFEKGVDEVEVNLALDSKKDNLLESHLSIHVRKATDVEVFIPVPAQYYCQADDMDIVLNHAGNFVHGGPYITTYNVDGNEVTLTVEFEEDGIRISTSGITQEVIDYCRENYQDGITFEIWNYFNDPETGLPYISMDELKEYLDRSTVRFNPEIPGSYINAFGNDNGKYDPASNPDGKDFHVVPEYQVDSFDAPYEGPHYNGSEFNDIYRKK